jgi:catechol 2,3-dioxygenase-like lactoylglutathione lyase family enzyme
MGTFKRIAPIFPVRDVRISLEYYERLGFATREYARGGYGFVTREGIELHLGESPDASKSRPASAYLWVADSDELAKAWSAAGADVRFPEDTEWGQHEGVLVDPDGNMIRFGSPIK